MIGKAQETSHHSVREEKMKVRLSKEEDLKAIMEIYALARKFMKEQGNPTQWGEDYPSKLLIEADISSHQSFVVEEDGKIVGTFAFIIGEDPTYQVIEKGAWRSTAPYGTIHRIASNGQVKGIAHQVFDFCYQEIPHLRIDTHADNKPMQAAILSYGFIECGIIYIADGNPRLAYDYYR